ncbi:PfkB family carbohydrate kinase [Massilia sp. CCM 8734]|uniref:PfkB family carbohydrate kinase n=1 Tax=Massilia sp. CCM 8734 TaxID=2609283 RepID=UPI00141FB944|nr:PfkB family carbohydrate kinase [Massilia sp. CCM 8734]NHZ96109.1 carbohydrate kinase [Massilia sp. CCM 8734]
MVDAPFMLCAGEALTDMIHQGREQWVSRVGGSTWNVARALAVLGEPNAFAGAISRDRFGDTMWQASPAVDLRLLQRVGRAPLLAMVEQGEPPRYFFIGDDSADLHFDPATLPAGWADGLRWAHFSGISLAISYDPNYRNLMDARYTPTLEAMASLADLIKVSDDDLRGLFPGLGLDHALAPRVAVVDTAGAGGASAAGLLHSLARHPDRPLQAHLHAALAAGCAACLQAGAIPPPPAAARRHASIVLTV